MTKKRGLSMTAVQVIQAIAAGYRYGFDVMDATGLPSGTVYPALSRLERDGLLRSSWESADVAHTEKRPPRRYYRVTAAGVQALEAALDRLRRLEEARRAAQRKAGVRRPGGTGDALGGAPA
jgi:PadR family transcriptional regulator PadR